MVSATSRGSPRRRSGASAAHASKNLLLAFSRGGSAGFRQFFQSVGGCETGTDVVDQDSIFSKLVGEALNQSDYGRTHRIRKHKIGTGCFVVIEVSVMMRPQRFRCMWGMTSRAK